MSGSNYAHCDADRSCLRESTKVFYDSFDGLVIPEGTVILHPECAAARDAAAEERGRQQMIAALRDGEGMAPFVAAHRERERQQPSPLRFAPTREVLADYLEYVAKEMGTQ